MNPRFIISYVSEFFYAAVVVDFWVIFGYSGTLLDHKKEFALLQFLVWALDQVHV